MTDALKNAAEQFVAHAADVNRLYGPGMLDYFAEIFGEALAKPQPVGGALTDEQILAMWQAIPAEEGDRDLYIFARAILAIATPIAAQPAAAVAVAQVVAIDPPGPDGHGVNWLNGKSPKPGTLLYEASK
jgi:hypothetical protein